RRDYGGGRQRASHDREDSGRFSNQRPANHRGQDDLRPVQRRGPDGEPAPHLPVSERRLNIAIIAAAGIGTRMGAGRAKQMIELGGVPLLVHTLTRFEQSSSVDQVLLVLQPDLTGEVLTLISRYGLRKVSRVVAGGAERQDSVYRGLQVLDERTVGIVAIPDPVRPFALPAEKLDVVNRPQ